MENHSRFSWCRMVARKEFRIKIGFRTSIDFSTLSSYSVAESPSLFRPMCWLAAPVLLEELLSVTVGWTDWWLAGHYLEGTAPKAAMSLLSYMMWLIPSMFSAISIGSTALIARFTGSGDPKSANHCANQSILLGAIVAIVATAAILILHRPFIQWMHLPIDAQDFAADYLKIVALVVPLIMFEQVGAACLRGAGDTVSGFFAKSIVNVINIFLSLALVSGWWIFPNMGFTGLAIGTAVGHGVGGLILFGFLIFGRAGLKLNLADFLPDRSLIWRLLRIGMPGGVDVAAVLSCQFLFMRIVYELGEASAAAHGLAIQIEALAFLPGTAFQVSAATMSGQLLGAKQNRRASNSVFLNCASAMLLMGSAGLFFYFGGHYLTNFFTGDSDPETAKLSSELLKIVAVSMPALSLVLVISGALRGAGDTKWPLLITLFGFLVIRIPLAIYLAYPESTSTGFWPPSGINLGIHGAWWAMVTDLFVRSVLLVGRLLHGGWRKIKV